MKWSHFWKGSRDAAETRESSDRNQRKRRTANVHARAPLARGILFEKRSADSSALSQSNVGRAQTERLSINYIDGKCTGTAISPVTLRDTLKTRVCEVSSTFLSRREVGNLLSCRRELGKHTAAHPSVFRIAKRDAKRLHSNETTIASPPLSLSSCSWLAS